MNTLVCIVAWIVLPPLAIFLFCGSWYLLYLGLLYVMPIDGAQATMMVALMIFFCGLYSFFVA